jgi:hypothetical protein
LYFADYTGKIFVSELWNYMSSRVIYLVDKENRTGLCIELGLYKQPRKIIAAIPLETIDFYPTRKESLKLTYGGKITVKKQFE